MTVDDSQQLEQLRASVADMLHASPELANYATTACLRRYLRARSNNVHKASAMLRSTLKWRQDYKPQHITWDQVKHVAQTGRVELLPQHRDSAGRPIVLIRVREKMVDCTPEEQLRFMIYNLESAAYLADKSGAAGGGKVTWLLEMEDYSSSNSPPFSVTKDSLFVLQQHYPERLGHAVLVYPPTLFWLLYKACAVFLDVETVNRIKFINPGESAVESLKGVIPESTLDTRMGGQRSVEFDWEVYGAHMRELDARRQGILKEHVQRA